MRELWPNPLVNLGESVPAQVLATLLGLTWALWPRVELLTVRDELVRHAARGTGGSRPALVQLDSGARHG